jgi:hypothetical protein
MYRWLKPGGLMSHQIDFTAHQTSDKWYGHWTYSDFLWTVIRGGRHFWLNREPHSTHIRLLESSGFEVIGDVKTVCQSEIESVSLAPRFRHLSPQDLTTSGACVVARKPSGRRQSPTPLG